MSISAPTSSRWSTVPLVRLFRRVQRPPCPGDGVVTAFRDGQVALRSRRRTDGFTEAIQEIGYQGIRKGDLVIHAMDAFAGAIGVSEDDGKSSPVYTVLTPSSTVEPRFYAYVLRNFAKAGGIQALTQGIRERSTDFRWAVAKTVPVPFPEPEEQTAIADYLDRETAEIDSLIDLWNELLTLAQERKQAYLDNVVTSSTDKFVRVKHLLTRPISDGPHETPDFLDQGIPFLSVDGIQDGELVFEGCRYVSREDHLRYSKKIYPLKGDVLMGKAASTGKIALVRTEREFNVWSPLAVLRPNISLVSGDWLTWALKSTAAQVQIDLACTFNTQKNIAMSDIGDLEVPVPSLEDQSRLVGTLDGFSNRAREVEKEISAAIELATERRAALISATVTGQVDISPQGAPVAESLRNELEVRV